MNRNWFCVNCHAVRVLDIHGRCSVCQSDSIVSAVPPRRTVAADGTVRILKELGIPVTRENYLMLAFAGHPPDELDGEIEAMIPREILAAEKRAIRRADRKWLREIGVSR